MKRCLAVLFTLLAVAALAPLAQAKAPMVQSQAPGYYRMQLGAFEITALHDGPTTMNAGLLKNIEAAETERLAGRMFVDYPAMQGTVNAYLVNTGTHLVLVDAGASKSFNPNLGNLLANMQAAGYSPAQVDTILLTHLHPDHIGALTDAAGNPVFAGAQIFTAEKEHAYWLGKDALQTAPADKQPMFKAAQLAAVPIWLASNGRPLQKRTRWCRASNLWPPMAIPRGIPAI